MCSAYMRRTCLAAPSPVPVCRVCAYSPFLTHHMQAQLGREADAYDQLKTELEAAVKVGSSK